MPAIGQLEKDAKYTLVYQLLKIFLTQRLDAFLEFLAANSALLKGYGNIVFGVFLFSSNWILDELYFLQNLIINNCASFNIAGLVHEDCIVKMRLMLLVDLCSNGSDQIPYALIRDTLRVK